jgi:FlaA1/EpsC-like NDP-sugar epimerase
MPQITAFSSAKQFLLQVPRTIKQSIAVASDLLVLAFACVVAMDLRAEKMLAWSDAHTWMTVWGAVLAVPIFTLLGLYRAIFRWAGLQVLYTLNKALLIYGVLFAAIFTILGVSGVPKSMGLMQPVIFAIGVMASRLMVRRWLGGLGHARLRSGVQRALVYGAGSAGRQLANGLNMAAEVQIVGYVDDDERLHGHVLNGLPIFGPDELARACDKHRISQIFLALPSVSRRRRNEIIEGLLPLKLQVRTLPGISELANGQVEVSDLKELDVEDLLGRDPVVPNSLMMAKNTASKVVLVTGAGGSIGSELCRQILKAGPAKLLLVELTEFALYAIEQELISMIQASQTPVRTQLVSLLADVRSSARMGEIMRTWQPHTVYHAAAFKHVPLVEHNPAEGVRNNVQGTWVTAQQAQANGVHDFVFVSTDKAVRPTNFMGASKRLAELVLQAMAQQGSEQNFRMRLSMVRFGNVLGSSGSVVPLFRKQIQQGGPITLTDARITRYFMTIPEAAQLVIQAGAMASGGDVFVLDMGESVKIIDLARKMIELSGLTVQSEENPQGDIAIEVTGLRPGEKLYEELLIGDNPLQTKHPRIMKAHEEFLPWTLLQPQLQKLMQAVEVNDVLVIRYLIQKLVPGYQPESDVVDWVWLEQGQAD